jgi:hypothetical protein
MNHESRRSADKGSMTATGSIQNYFFLKRGGILVDLPTSLLVYAVGQLSYMDKFASGILSIYSMRYTPFRLFLSRDLSPLRIHFRFQPFLFSLSVTEPNKLIYTTVPSLCQRFSWLIGPLPRRGAS